MADFSDVCTDSTHNAVHYDELGYMKCDIDEKFVYADGRAITFTNPKDQEHYEKRRRRVEVVCGRYKSRLKEPKADAS